MSRPLSICAFGTFDRGFDRSWILLEALEQSGASVTLCHFDLWAKHRHKTRLLPWGWLTLLVRYAAGLASLCVRFLRTARCDVLYVGYLGHVDLIVAYCLNVRRRSTLVFDPCISLFNTLVDDRGLVRHGGVAARCVRWLDVLPCSLADIVLIDAQAHGRYFAETLGVPPSKIRRVFIGARQDVQSARWQPQAGPFRVFFAAKFAPLHGIGTILEAVRRLKDDAVHFTIVGSGQLEDDVRTVAEGSELRTLEWIPWLEHDALIERMRGCHLTLGIFGSTVKAGMVIPNKVFHALAIGAPIITRDCPAMRELVEDGCSAILCPAGDATALADSIVRCMNDFDALQTIGAKGREAFLDRAGHRAIARQFRDAIDAA